MKRLKSLVFVALLVVLAFWNFRLHRENRRLASILRDARRQESQRPVAAQRIIAEDPETAIRMQDERDTIDALAQRLHEAGVVNVSGLKRGVSNQQEIVDNLNADLKRLNASRPAALDAKAQRQQLAEQIDSEKQLVASLKAGIQRYRSSKKKEQRAKIPSLAAQVEAENQVLHDLKEQRAQLAKQPRNVAALTPEETPEQLQERQQLEARLAKENARLTTLKAELSTAKKAPVDAEAARVQQELEKHQATLRSLETKVKAAK